MSSDSADYSETSETVITGSFAEFLVQYFIFSTSKDEFHDRCRQFRDFEGPAEARKQILDQCRELSDEIAGTSDFRNIAMESINDLSPEPGNADIVRRINLAVDYAQEDRDMANDFSLIVYAKEQGRDRTPRMRKVVNPFEPILEEPEEPETVEEPPAETEEETTPEATEDGS